MSITKKVRIEVEEDDEKIIDFPMKKTEIQMDQAEKRMLIQNPDDKEETEFKYKFLICCWKRPILESARTVSFLSAASFLANLISLVLAGSQTSLHFVIETVILILEFFSLLLLFYALSHQEPKFMKPYMVFGVIWNIFLILLWLFCFAELLKGAQFPFRVSSALSQVFLPSNYRRRSIKNGGIFTAFLMLMGLGTTIAANFWLLHIIVLAYFYLKQRGKQSSSWTPTITVSAPTSPPMSKKNNLHPSTTPSTFL